MINRIEVSFIKRRRKISELNYVHFLKVAIGSTLAVMVAKYVGLNYATSAGIITLLTIQTTKKETLEVSINRVLAFLIAISLASVLFLQFGFYTVIYGVFLLFFIILCNLFGLEVGITSNAVLMTHLLSQGAININTISNEVFILLIGASIGIFINLFIPKKEKRIKEKQKIIDMRMKEILYHLSEEIIATSKAEEEAIFQNIDTEIEIAMKVAKEVLNNSFDSDAIYYINYMDMRRSQCMILKNIHHHIHRLGKVQSQAYEISTLIKHISASFHEYNNADNLLDTLNKQIDNFKEHALPMSRDEFENRAVLYQILHDFQYFLTLKHNFSHSLTERQKAIFWKELD